MVGVGVPSGAAVDKLVLVRYIAEVLFFQWVVRTCGHILGGGYQVTLESGGAGF